METNAYLDSGRANFYDEIWYVELAGGEQILLGRWPHPDLYHGRDENRKVEVSVLPRIKGEVGRGKFVRFLD